MFETPFSKLALISSLLLSLFILAFLSVNSYNNSTTTVVFCDVGQGDATYIRIKNRLDVLIDAGSNKKILECLGKYMPFYDRSIELAIISHSENDHFGGFLYILDRYDVKKLWMGELYGSAKSVKELLDKIESKEIIPDFPKAGETATFSDVLFDFYWPSDGFITVNTVGKKISHRYFRQTTGNLNDFSLIFSVSLNNVKILFTGDASPYILNRLLRQTKIKSDIVKIPHHGSKNGLTLEFLKLADPTYGVISAGKNNSYGHPNKIIIDMLTTQNIIIKRTDLEGDVIFKFPDKLNFNSP